METLASYMVKTIQSVLEIKYLDTTKLSIAQLLDKEEFNNTNSLSEKFKKIKNIINDPHLDEKILFVAFRKFKDNKTVEDIFDIKDPQLSNLLDDFVREYSNDKRVLITRVMELTRNVLVSTNFMDCIQNIYNEISKMEIKVNQQKPCNDRGNQIFQTSSLNQQTLLMQNLKDDLKIFENYPNWLLNDIKDLLIYEDDHLIKLTVLKIVRNNISYFYNLLSLVVGKIEHVDTLPQQHKINLNLRNDFIDRSFEK